MALPKIINDIESRVKDTGDTMSGPLAFNNGNSKINANDNALIQQIINKDNTNRQLLLNSKDYRSELKHGLSIKEGETNYFVYGEHNKPTANDVGALSINGGTISGSLKVLNGYGELCAENTNIAIRHFSTVGDNSNYSDLFVSHTNSLNGRVKLRVNDNGTLKLYSLYGEHNKPTPAAIGAPTATGSGASGTWGISISGNAATATKATQDGNGANIASTYLKYSGGTMTGDISFATIASWPTVSGETYPILSKGLYWSGSSDLAKLFFRVTGSDKGELVLQLGDGSDERFVVENLSGTSYGIISSNGFYGKVVVPTGTDYTTMKSRNIAANTSLSTPANGNIFLVYT